MCGNGAGIPPPTTARTATTAAAAGSAAPTTARWTARSGTTPMAPTSTLASVLSALLAKNSELRRCSAGVAQAASRSGAGTEQPQASRKNRERDKIYEFKEIIFEVINMANNEIDVFEKVFVKKDK